MGEGSYVTSLPSDSLKVGGHGGGGEGGGCYVTSLVSYSLYKGRKSCCFVCVGCFFWLFFFFGGGGSYVTSLLQRLYIRETVHSALNV